MRETWRDVKASKRSDDVVGNVFSIRNGKTNDMTVIIPAFGFKKI